MELLSTNIYLFLFLSTLISFTTSIHIHDDFHGKDMRSLNDIYTKAKQKVASESKKLLNEAKNIIKTGTKAIAKKSKEIYEKTKEGTEELYDKAK